MKMQPERISVKELLLSLNKKDVSIIDIRPVDAYNGWKMKGERRGGHIPGARSLPAKWTLYMDWIEIVRSKGILPEHKIIIYGYSGEEARRVAEMFQRADYRRVWIYEGFLDEWSAGTTLPLDRLERYRHLVYPEWVAALVRGERPPEFEGNDFVICHGHYRNRAAYEEGHIPGAIPLDTNWLESPETWNRRSPGELRATLEKLGISEDTTVILYGRFSFPDNNDPFPGSSAGHLGSIRAAFIMMYAGVKDVRILNGGLQSWEDEGHEVSTENAEPRQGIRFKASIPARPELAVDVPEAKEMIASDDAEIVCVRSYPEYIGEVSGYNYIDKKGRIPGAIFGNCGSDAYHMENYRNLDHTTREYHEIAAVWEEAGIIPDKHNAFYCGTGWRGSEAWMNAWLMGWPRVSVFDGGWYEWSSDPANPTDTGIPQSK